MNKKLLRVLSIMLAAVMLFSLCSCDSYEEEEEKIKYASEVPSGKEAIVTRFNEVIATAKAGTPAVKYSLDQSAKSPECENQYVKGSFKTVADMITKESFKRETKFGESAKDILPIMDSEAVGSLGVTDVRSAYITDNINDKTYMLVLTINPEKNPKQDNSIYGKLYNITKDEEILEKFKVVENLMTVGAYSASYQTGTIKAVIDKTTDHLVKLELGREVLVETEVTGQGTIANIGTVPLTFKYNSTAKFDLDWDNPETEAVEA